MVLYFLAKDGHFVYMGKDKYENEDLIKYGFDEDIWFHVDDLSSAHVYLRLNKNEKWDEIPQELIDECAQLVKENSIEGCKQDSVKIVYTPWTNLLKTKDMEVGAIGFKDEKMKKYIQNVQKDKLILKRIEKTKEEKYPNLQELQEKHILEEKKEKFKQFKIQQKEQKELERQRKEEEELRDYKHMMDPTLMKSNKNAKLDDDDFM